MSSSSFLQLLNSAVQGPLGSPCQRLLKRSGLRLACGGNGPPGRMSEFASKQGHSLTTLACKPVQPAQQRAGFSVHFADCLSLLAASKIFSFPFLSWRYAVR